MMQKAYTPSARQHDHDFSDYKKIGTRICKNQRLTDTRESGNECHRDFRA